MNKETNLDNKNRRQFLGSMNCAALGSIGFYNALLNLKMMGNVAAQSTGANGQYKALVCLYLHGGNDSYNMLLPTDNSEYNNYQAIRSNMAVASPGSGSDSALPINRLNSSKTPDNNGRGFAVNPSMPGMQALFNQGDLAFVANVGTLVEPTTVSQYKAGAVSLPRSLFAHNAQMMEWQTSIPQGGVTTGWLGRMADLMEAPSAGYNTGNVSMNISLSGNNFMQTGNDSLSYSITPEGSVALTGEGATSGFTATRVNTAKSLMEDQYKQIFVEAFAKSNKQSFDQQVEFSSAFDSVNVSTPFPDTNLGNDLKGVAQTIASNMALGHNRQTYFVRRGGFDNHSNLLAIHTELLTEVDEAVTAFWAALGELGLQDNVVLFSASEFSRTLRSNGFGTDHAWGGNHFVLGGEVDGQKVYGKYPDPNEFTLNSGLDVGSNGRLLPTTSTDEYYADLALWLGVSPSDLNYVLPNLNNFPNNGNNPIGFVS